ncbi:hypothetical protein Trydic_g8065 [Trypoxylus dichotomus]
MALSAQAGDSSGNPPLRKKKPLRAHKALKEASKAKPGTKQKQEKATREAPEAQSVTSHSKATGVKRNLSDGSTPRVAAELIQNYILEELDKLNVEGPEPKFSKVRHRAGMLKAACVEADTCSWLAHVARNCAPWNGAKLKLVREDDLPKPITALVQNQKLPINSWRVVSAKADPKGQRMVVAMDESSWKVLQDTYHGRLHLQFSSVSFRLVGRKTKEQAEAQERIDTTVAGPSNLSTP